MHIIPEMFSPVIVVHPPCDASLVATATLACCDGDCGCLVVVAISNLGAQENAGLEHPWPGQPD
eukprot:COSAG02_NODE_49171_length_328_cov_1.131004_1_plen_63_part_10